MRTRSLVVQIVLLAMAITTNLNAEVRRKCHVYYETNDGWSQGYLMEVTFLSGFELVRKTNNISLDVFAKYALVWFGKGEVAIIKLNSNAITSNNFSASDFKMLYFLDDSVTGVQINSEAEREWAIAAKVNFSWIDGRANGY